MRFRMTALALASFITLPMAALADSYTIDSAHSSIAFSIRHLVAKTSGRFTEFGGTLQFDPANPQGGSVNVTIQAASITTDNEHRDNDLRSDHFFEVETYPEITFSGQVTGTTDDGFNVTGTLSMHGVDKEVVMPVEFLGVGPDARGNQRVGFAAELEIDRKEFGITWNRNIDQGGVLLGDDVDIRISIEAVRQQAETKAAAEPAHQSEKQDEQPKKRGGW